MARCRVVIVDDSPTMRALVAAALADERDIEIVGVAGDPYEAREVIKRVNPDVITLDIEMPRMDGLTFLEKLMRLRPIPTIMVSTLTSKGASASVGAMALGAFDCVLKPSPTNPSTLDNLPELVRAAAASTPSGVSKTSNYNQHTNFNSTAPPVFIGSSTGGVEALSVVFSEYGASCPPTFVVQHMPAGFTGSLAKRLDDLSPAQVVEAEDMMPIKRGTVYIAPGGSLHMTVKNGMVPRVRMLSDGPVNGHRPSVDVLFRSALQAYGGETVGVLLTGMGNDGAQGLLELQQAGATTIVQDQDSSVVYGMPRRAVELGAAMHQVHINNVSHQIEAACGGASVKQAC